MTITVQWPSLRSVLGVNRAKFAEVWRVLDFSGISQSPRQSMGFVKSGIVFLNGNRVQSLKSVVEVGSLFTLEVRIPGGRTRSASIRLVEQGPSPRQTERKAGTGTGTFPRVINYRG